MEFEGLERLEEIVGRLLSQHAELKEQNEKLTAEIEEKKMELSGLHDQIAEMKGDKEKVHQRVSSILNKLEQWEKPAEESAPVEQEAPQHNPAIDSESQKQLFNMGA